MLHGSQSSKNTKCPLPFTKIALAGGSTRGYGYVGIVEELERIGLLKQIDFVYGTSVGAIVSLIIATGWPFDKIKEMYEKIDAKKWTYSLTEDDDSIDFEIVPENYPSVLSKAWNLFTQLGLHNGNAYIKFFRAILKERTVCPSCKGGDDQITCRVKEVDATGTLVCLFKDGLKDCTFSQWEKFKIAYPEEGTRYLGVDVCLANTDCPDNLEFSHKSEDEFCRHTSIADAVRASMAMQGFFTPKVIQGHTFNDGGLLKNFPITRLILDKKSFDPTVMGVYLADEKEIRLIEKKSNIYPHDIADTREKGKISSLANLFSATMTTAASPQRQQHIDSPYVVSTIHLDTLGIGMLNMELTKEEREALRLSGQYAVVRWLAMHHEALAIQHYGDKLIANIKANHYTPSLMKFLEAIELRIDIEGLDDDFISGWKPLGGLLKIIHGEHHHQLDNPKPPPLFATELPFAHKTYTPKLNAATPSVQDIFIKFVASLDNTFGCFQNNIDFKNFNDPVQFMLNQKIYERGYIQNRFLQSLPANLNLTPVEKDNLFKQLNDFLVGIYTDNRTVNTPREASAQNQSGCNLM